MNKNEYINREELLEHLDKCRTDPLFDPEMSRICCAISAFIENMQTADVQTMINKINNELDIMRGTVKNLENENEQLRKMLSNKILEKKCDELILKNELIKDFNRRLTSENKMLREKLSRGDK